MDETEAELAELQKVVLHLKQLNGDNEHLRANFESLKDIHINVSESYQQLQFRYSKLYDERVSVERHYQQLCESWREQLEAKQKDFDEARAQIMQPRELELLRLKLMEELEIPHREKCSAFEAEAERAYEQCLQAKREADHLRAEVDSLSAKGKKEVEYMKSDHEAALNNLKHQLDRMRSLINTGDSQEERILSSQKELASRNAQVSRLQTEVDALRAMKEKAAAQTQKDILDYQNKIKKLTAERDAAHKQLEAVERKLRHSGEQVAEATRSCDSLHQQLLAADRDRASSAARLEDAAKAHTSERDTWQTQRLVLERERDEFKQQASKASLLHEQHLADLSQQHAAELALVREQSQMAVQATEDKIAAMQKRADTEVAEMRAYCKTIEQSREEATGRLEADNEALQKAAGEARARADKLAAELDLLERDRDDARADARQAISTLSGRDVEVETLKAELEFARTAAGDAQKVLDKLRVEHAQLQAGVAAAGEEAREAARAHSKALQEAQDALEGLRSTSALKEKLVQRDMAQLKAHHAQKQQHLVKAVKEKMKKAKRKMTRLQREHQTMKLELQESDAKMGRLTAVRGGSVLESAKGPSDYASQLSALRERQTEYLAATQQANVS